MFDSLIDESLLDRMTKDFALHRLTPLVGRDFIDKQELYYRLWRRWLCS